jgi:hypothetical protein
LPSAVARSIWSPAGRQRSDLRFPRPDFGRASLASSVA